MQSKDGVRNGVHSQHHEHLRLRIEALMRRIFANVRPQVAEVRLLAELTMPQLKTLLLLHSDGTMRMGDLASRLGIGLPTATTLVTRLEDKGLAARHHTKDDRRVVLCSATEAGTHEAERFWEIWRERVDAVVDALNEEELEAVVRGMELVAAAGERSTHPSYGVPSSERPAARVSSSPRKLAARPT